MDLFKKTFNLFDQTMKQFGEDIKEAMEKMEKVLNEKTDCRITTVRIKKGSKIIVNGAVVTLKDDAIVETTDPDTLMGKDND